MMLTRFMPALSAALFLSLSATNSSAQLARLPGVVDKPTPGMELPDLNQIDEPNASPLAEAPVLNRIPDADEYITTLRSVEFEGNTVIRSSTLQKLIKPYLNKAMTKGELAKLKHDIRKFFYDKGYIFVLVVTKPQDFSTGNLKVSIYEAKVGDKYFEGDFIRPYILKGISQRTPQGSVIHEERTESMISDITDLRDVEASLTLKPGKKTATTDMYITLTEKQEDVQMVSVDNYGNDLTGKIITTGHFEKSNTFKMGEKLYVDLQKSNESLFGYKVGGVIPTGLRNINFETSYTRQDSEIGGRLNALQATGETRVFDAAISSKLHNTRDTSIVLRGGYETRTHESRLANTLDTSDKLHKAYIENTYLYKGYNKVIYGAAKLSKGLNFSDTSHKGGVDVSRAVGDPEAYIFEPVIVANIRPFKLDGEFKTFAAGQMSSHKLLSSDLFAIGGYGSIRGFNMANEAAEMGYIFSGEYNHALPFLKIKNTRVSAGPFIDGGAIYNRVAGTVQDSHFYSTGLGLEITTKLSPKVSDTKLRFDWAHPIGDYQSPRISSNTFYFSVKQYF